MYGAGKVLFAPGSYQIPPTASGINGSIENGLSQALTSSVKTPLLPGNLSTVT
jgi:hypothetical protein